MSGDLLRTATYANSGTSYFLKAGEPITTPVVFADGITVSGGIGVPTGDVAIIQGSLTVQTGGIGVGGEIIANGGITNSGAPISSTGQDIIATEGGQVVAYDGVNTRVKMATENQALAYVEMTGNTDDGPAIRLAVGGGSAVAPYETYKFGIYANQGGTSPFVEALTVDDNALVKIAGAPVARPFKVAYVGLVGTDITVAPGQTEAQTISANFAVKAGHTYRVSLQCLVANADLTTTQNFTAFYATTDPSSSVSQVGLGSLENYLSGSTNGQAYSGVFVAISDSTTCHVECFNSSATQPSIITLNAVNVANAPSILVEDLGVI